MSFPDGLPTTLLTYSPANPAGGGPAVGTVRLELNVPAVVVPQFGKVFTGSGTYSFNQDGNLADAQGNVGVRILPNDVPGINPRGSLWLVTETIKGARPRSYYMRISASQEEADLSLQQEINPDAAQYVPVVGPPGVKGDKGDQGDPGTGGGGGGAPSGPAGGDLSGTYPDPSVAKVGGVAISGTPSTGQVPTATGAAAATWQTPTAPPAAAGTVSAQTSFGGTSSAGTATTYSRGDHTHGTPAAPTLAGLGGLAKTSNLGDVASTATARTNLGLGTAATQDAAAFDTAGAAGTVASALTAHANAQMSVHGIPDTSALVTTSDSRLTDARTPTGTAGGDLSGTYPNPAVAKVGGVAVSGTAASGKVLTASSPTAASWQTPTGGGGGSSIVSQGDDRIDLEIVTLTNSASWTVVRTSGGVAIGKSVKAAANDRVLVAPSFMYAGTQYELDLAVMASDGTSISRYAGSSGSRTGPGAEGYAPLYTQATSFPHMTGPIMFTVAPGEVDGTGKFTVNLAYHAPSLSGTDQHIYAGNGYIARWLMLNIGPEPA